VQHVGQLGVGLGRRRLGRRRDRPMRRTPSRISASPTPEKFSRIAFAPRPSRNAERPGTKATCSSSARASRSVVSMYSGSVTQMNRPPCGCVQVHSGPKLSASESSMTSRRRR
jgi:hypothetical protein